MGSIVLCRSGEGPDPKITHAVFVEDDSAVQVTAFASRTRTADETMLGSNVGGLADAGFAQGNASVGTPCDADAGKVTELGITARSETAKRSRRPCASPMSQMAGRNCRHTTHLGAVRGWDDPSSLRPIEHLMQGARPRGTGTLPEARGLTTPARGRRDHPTLPGASSCLCLLGPS